MVSAVLQMVSAERDIEASVDPSIAQAEEGGMLEHHSWALALHVGPGWLLGGSVGSSTGGSMGVPGLGSRSAWG